ncbi:3,5-dihydroxyphenylacetyl-CoA synthase DpgA, partial [Streptomyces sp. DT18]
RCDWADDQGRVSFGLEPLVPSVGGAHAESVGGTRRSGTGLRRADLAPGLVHSGGKKVIDSVRVNLGLTQDDVRHTTEVLRDYGNVS